MPMKGTPKQANHHQSNHDQTAQSAEDKAKLEQEIREKLKLLGLGPGSPRVHFERPKRVAK
jgi:hypothetical protein